DAGVPDARDPDAVVSPGSDDAGHPGAVAVRIRLAVRSVEHRCTRHDVGGQVRMGSVDSGVEYRHFRRAQRRDISVRLIPTDPREGPLTGILGVARGRLDVAYLIGLDAAH